MDIESVRALKAELSERVVRPLVLETRERRDLDVAACSARRLTGIEPSVALGIGRGSGPGDYSLAVRIQHRALEAEPVLREQVVEAARREVDIRYIGRVSKDAPDAAAPWQRQRQRPLLIGVSVGHFAVTAGTLGAFAQNRRTGRPVILSNNHVLANENRGKVGDAILQPGAHDGGRRRADQVGTLLEFVPLRTGGANLVDAAIAALDPEITFDGRTLTGVGSLDGAREAPLEPGDAVIKIGRTTGVTRGIVTSIELDDVVVGFERGNLSFDRQIEIEGTGDRAFSAGGDSGSLIVDPDGFACGLLFAGSDQGGRNGKGLTYANEIALVLAELDLALEVEALVA